MPQVEINDEVMEAKLGERLLTIARRNAAHIGFGCDGKGLCTMCECRILSGGDQLNSPTEAEFVWLPQERLDEGYRLGCQAALRAAGPIRVLTRPEELRRQLNATIVPPTGTTSAENLRPLLSNLVAINWQHIGTFPLNLLRTLNRLGPFRFLWPFEDLGRFADDSIRITRRMLDDDRPVTSEARTKPILIEDASSP